MSRTIDEQIDSMATLWPDIKLVRREGSTALWVGPRRPLLQTYQIAIFYEAPHPLMNVPIRQLQPTAKIIEPALRPRSGDPEGRYPHVYYGDGPDDVFLCLLDPNGREWSASDLLAETTVPWTSDWLAAYEGWRATGEWAAPGRHMEA